jgi:phosphate-selective porin OprO/OprP
MKKLALALFVAVLGTVFSQSATAQDETSNKFGKGLINVVGRDSSWSAKVAFRFQTRYEGTYYLADDTARFGPQYTDRYFVRRARIKGSGYAFSPKVRYKFEYDVHNGFVLDAVIKWNFAGNWDVWFGQTKLPGNIERVFSSQKLQLVDRSMLNSKFTLDRDAGVQLRHHFKLGETFVVREKFAVSQGEGLNQTEQSSGNGYTARLELLPFGKFTGKGDYFAADLKREEKPKLMLSATYDYNVDALRTRGQKGDYVVAGPRDLQTIFADVHFKYKGFSIFGEYVTRTTTDGSPVIDGTWDAGGEIIDVNETYYTGTAMNASLGYNFKSNWEVAARYTTVTPESVTMINNINQYTFGISRYVVGHNLKIQGDISLTQEDNNPNDEVLFRLQTEFNF